MKAEKWFVGGIATWRVKIELNNKTRDSIVIESWSKKECLALAKKINETITKATNTNQ